MGIYTLYIYRFRFLIDYDMIRPWLSYRRYQLTSTDYSDTVFDVYLTHFNRIIDYGVELKSILFFAAGHFATISNKSQIPSFSPRWN